MSCCLWVLFSICYHFHFSLSCIGEGNGNPLQCSCLENPKDSEAWWAAVYGVTQSQTRLKRLSSKVLRVTKDEMVGSLIQWTWTWANSRRQWRTGKPGMLQSMGSRRVRHNLETEQQQCITMNIWWGSRFQFSSVAQSRPTLRMHELHHARPPCPSLTPGVYSDSRPSS